MKGELEVLKNQSSLTFYNKSLKDILSDIYPNLSYDKIKFWFDIGLLSELPKPESIPYHNFNRQLTFLYRLNISGLRWERVMEFLNEDLEKPYCYDTGDLLYDVERDEFTARSYVEDKILKERGREYYINVLEEIDRLRRDDNYQRLRIIRDRANKALERLMKEGESL